MSNKMKCAVCGNSSENDLFDEDEYIYCSICKMRTIKSSGKALVTKCRFCGRYTCGNTSDCMFCGNPIKHVGRVSKQDKEDAKALVADYERSISPFRKETKGYWKYSFRRKRIMRTVAIILGLLIIMMIICVYMLYIR